MSVVAASRPLSLQEIGQLIIDRVGVPKDRWEIAAQLEVMGYRDSDARKLFGSDDLFQIADRILALFHEGKLPFEVEGEDPVKPVNPVLLFLRHYRDGLMISLPMVIQGATMLTWGYGLWGAVDLDVRTGTAIALGFIGSYIAASGFAWAIVRRGLFYYYQKEGSLARWSALRMWSISIRVTLAAALPALAINLIYTILPFDLFFIALAYYAGLTIFWLNWSLIYLVRKLTWLLVALVASIGVVVFAVRGLGWPIVAAHIAGLAVANVLTFLIAKRALDRWAASNGGSRPVVNPPRLTVLVYSTAQVFLYGLLYSTFIFMDRMLAWTGSRGREDFPPYPFWLNARYELGMDLALIVVVLMSGVVEFSTDRFSVSLVPLQKRVKSALRTPFLEEFQRFYRRHALLLTISGLLSVAAAAAVFLLLQDFPDPRLQESLRSQTAVRVFWLAAVSYAVFMFAVQSVLMLMTLSRADLAVRAIAAALAVNFVVGFVASRAWHYSGSVAGLMAGSLVLAFLAHRHVRRVLGDLDYYYYAAY